VRSRKKFNVPLCQKVLFVLVCFQASATPRSENSDSEEKDALFDTQITILELLYLARFTLTKYHLQRIYGHVTKIFVKHEVKFSLCILPKRNLQNKQFTILVYCTK
jgi:hypothetical protein